MEIDFKEGDVVVHKANGKKQYVVIEINEENKTALLSENESSNVRLPLVVLKKYIPPKGPSVSDISNMW